MNKLHGIKYLFGLFCISYALQASAIDWGNDNDDEDSSTGNLKEMVDRVKDKFDDINNNPNLKDTLSEAADQVKKTLRDNRPTGDFASGCGGDCLIFRQEMLQFVSDIEFTTNTLRSLGEPIQQDNFEFKRTTKAIELAPGPVLFPLFVVFNETGVFNGLTTRFSNLTDSLELVREEFEDRPSKCERLLDDRQASRKKITRLAATGVALRLAGKALLAVGETNMMAKKKVGVHGYAGVIVEDNKKKKLGQLLDGLGGTLSTVAAKTDRTFYQCEILDTLFVHDYEIKAEIAQHDADVKVLLNEIIRLQLTPQGRRASEFVGDFPLK